MLQRAWWAALTLCLLPTIWEAPRADTLTIPFSELEDYALNRSSRAVVLNRQAELVRAERDEALQWSNPKIAFDREDVGLAENQFTIGKTFDPPWAHWQERSSWKSRVEAAESALEYGTRQLLAELKSRYVTLRLLDNQLAHLRHLEEIIPEVSRIVSSRRAEGHLSNVDEQLVRMALITLHAARQSTVGVRGRTDAEWRSLLGIGPETAISLSTAIPSKDVNLADIRSYLMTIDTSPGYRSRRLEAEFFRSQAGAARGRFIPRLNLYGGYKEIGSDQTGYVLGLSLGIPLFNRNGAAARQHELRSEIAEREAEAFRIHRTTRIEALLTSIDGSQTAFRTIGELPEDATLTVALLKSYEEGWISLHELLNAIQVAVSGLTDYHQQLTAYYEDIFELEAITGTTLIEFATEER